MKNKNLNKFKELWDKQELSTKAIILLGFIAFIYTSMQFLSNSTCATESDIALRSIMISIFGYILGSKVITKYNSTDRFYIAIAAIVAFLAIFVIIVSDVLNICQTSQNAVAIRSLLASSIGFLASKSSKDEDNK